MMVETWAVIASYNRLDDLTKLVTQLQGAGVRPVVVDNGYSPPLADIWEGGPGDVAVIRETRYGSRPNLSALWNLGLDYADEHHTGPDWACMVVNDDAVFPGGVAPYIAALTAPFSGKTAPAATFPSRTGEAYRLVDPSSVALHLRMTGWCFVISGATIYGGFRFDERFEWWFGDDDADWTLRTLGGTEAVRCPHPVGNTDADGWRNTDRGPHLAAAADEDRQRFITKWSRTPW